MARNETPVKVVIVTWNSESAIGACLDSLREQRGVDLRITVVDNASADRTVGIAQERGIEVIENQENVGFARAVNQGVSLLEEPFLLLLNPDTLLLGESSLLEATESLARDPRAGTLGTRIELPDGTLQPSAFAPPTLVREMANAWYVYKLLPRSVRARWLLGPHWAHDTKREVGWLLGAFLLIKREVWRALGGLTEDFHMFSEDMEWSTRAAACGWSNIFVPSPTLRHLSNESAGLRWGTDRSEISYRSYYRYLRSRHGSVRQLASTAVNWSGFVLRRCVYWLKARRTSEAETVAWHEEYKRLESFHRHMILRPGSFESG